MSFLQGILLDLRRAGSSTATAATGYHSAGMRSYRVGDVCALDGSLGQGRGLPAAWPLPRVCDGLRAVLLPSLGDRDVVDLGRSPICSVVAIRELASPSGSASSPRHRHADGVSAVVLLPLLLTGNGMSFTVAKRHEPGFHCVSTSAALVRRSVLTATSSGVVLRPRRPP